MSDFQKYITLPCCHFIVCGGRNYIRRERIYSVLDDFIRGNPCFDCLVQGGALGADYFAKQWAIDRKFFHKEFKADWKKLGPKAGPIRNKQMLDVTKPKTVIAFPGGKGTANMIKQSLSRGIPVIHIED